MAIYPQKPELEALAREICRETGESLTVAVTKALDERLERLRYRRSADDLVSQIMAISRRCSSLPDYGSQGPSEWA